MFLIINENNYSSSLLPQTTINKGPRATMAADGNTHQVKAYLCFPKLIQQSHGLILNVNSSLETKWFALFENGERGLHVEVAILNSLQICL